MNLTKKLKMQEA